MRIVRSRLVWSSAGDARHGAGDLRPSERRSRRRGRGQRRDHRRQTVRRSTRLRPSRTFLGGVQAGLKLPDLRTESLEVDVIGLRVVREGNILYWIRPQDVRSCTNKFASIAVGRVMFQRFTDRPRVLVYAKRKFANSTGLHCTEHILLVLFVRAMDSR